MKSPPTVMCHHVVNWPMESVPTQFKMRFAMWAYTEGLPLSAAAVAVEKDTVSKLQLLFTCCYPTTSKCGISLVYHLYCMVCMQYLLCLKLVAMGKVS